ncbi:hypothetical protein [Trichococcus collinsii]|uniref:DUF3784 domain-containing protein n=1 Tax=Trichococcus collinsii TaxID=157076 RepID=A0AB37ZX73_9LACT|nr:hypothetical protein [Trichococcus collinsii]CZQ80427.1 Hypothetical protein Tcol_40 [Trichococcus collinsii]SDZ92773.1 hypothetical protein SAMN04488525_101643 [Trichococcus collinsii]
MEILGTITLITALVTFIFKITKKITESLVFFSFRQTDDTRLKDDLTNPKEKDINTFTFSIIIVLIAYFISYITKVNLFISVLLFVIFSIIPWLYVISVIEKKEKEY